MPVHNADVAALFEDVADLLAIQGENAFRIRAYRNAARTLNQLSRPVADLVAAGEDLSDLPDIGDDLAGKIATIVETGRLPLYDELARDIPPSVADLLRIPGLGPKRVRRLRDALGVDSRAALKRAAETGKVQALDGFGETMEQNILDGLAQMSDDARWLLARVEPIVASLHDHVSAHDAVERVAAAGSYRRRKETVGDLDVLALADDGPAVTEHFAAYEDVAEALSQGDTRASVRLRSGLQVDLRVVPPKSYGAALLYFTGSKAHNVALRDRAVAAGLKLNEYGAFRDDTEKRVAGTTEDDIYDLFDLPYIVPELRENRGELDAAADGTLPDLVTRADLRGNLHTHTTYSDGRHSLEEMAAAAQTRGLEYLAITDHSPAVAVVQGLDADALRAQMDAIDRLNEDLDDLRVLKGIEVDILKDGSLDLPDAVLADLDLCLCALHTALDLDEETQTERVLRALDNPHVHVLAHPTGRRINERPPIEIDLDRVMEAAADRGCVLELNAQPERLDLSDVHCRRAKELGLPLVIGADAHSTDGLDVLRYGVDQARRGWLEADDVLNTKPWADIASVFDR